MGLFDGFDETDTNETLTEQQTAGEGGGAGSTTYVAGAYSQDVGAANVNRNIGNATIGKGGTQNITITNSDPEAIAALNQTSQDAINQTAQVALGAEEIGESSVNDITNASTNALNTVGANSTALEEIASQYEQGLLDAETSAATVANNATTGNAQPIEYQVLGSGTAGTGSALQSIALWVTIIGGLVALWFFLKKGTS